MTLPVAFAVALSTKSVSSVAVGASSTTLITKELLGLASPSASVTTTDKLMAVLSPLVLSVNVNL